MLLPKNLYIDNPAWPLLQAHVSYWGTTTAIGGADGLSLVCAGLANEPNYDGLTVKILAGAAAGQTKIIYVHAGNTIRVATPFTDSAGAVVQIPAGTQFVIISSLGGGGGPGPAPEEGLTYYGIVDAVPGANQFTISALAGLGAGKFAGATNPYAAFVLRDAGGASAAPQGEIQNITAYVTATGVFTTGAFTAAVAVGDEILLIHQSLAGLLLAPAIIASGTFTASSATVPADAARGEANNHFRGHILFPIAGAMRFRATRIKEFANAGGVFTVDPNNPFPAATGLVPYVILWDQDAFVPAVGAGINRSPEDVIGNKGDQPNFNTNNASIVFSLMSWLRGVARSKIQILGAAQAGSTAANIVDAANLVQGVGFWPGQSVLMLDGVNQWLSRPVSAFNAGANTITVDPAFPNVVGVGDSYIIMSDYTPVVPTADIVTNTMSSHVIGAKDDTAVQALSATSSLMRYLKGVVDMLVTAVGIIAWPARALPAANIAIAQALRYIAEVKPEWAARTSATHVTASGNEETILTTAYTVPGLFYFNLTLRNMVAGDDFTLRVYKRVDGANYDLKSEQNFVGAQSINIYEIEGLYTDGTEFVRVTIQRNSATNRSFPYSLNFLRQPVA